MKPSDLYALPSKSIEQWYAVDSDVWDQVFGISPGFVSQDVIEKTFDVSDRLMVETKLSVLLDWGERSASLTTLTFDGSPFAIFASAGRGESDFKRVFLTDAVVFEDAFRYFVSKAMVARDAKPMLIDANDDAAILEGFYGAAVVSLPDGVRMVRDDYVDEQGRLIFDDRKYNDAFEAQRKRLSRFPMDQALLAKETSVRQLFAEILEAGVADGLKTLVVNKRAKSQENKGDWIGVAAANDSGTYGIGIRQWSLSGIGFSWASAVFCERIGGPSLFDELKNSLTVSISDGMKP